MKRLIYLIMACVALAAVSGCTSYWRKKALEDVAKDWCMTIRAGQVIPVYPLQEDIRPGDVFVVQTPVAKQVEIYEQKGFLPLDLLVARLSSSDESFQPQYQGFYQDDYFQWNASKMPHKRISCTDYSCSNSSLVPFAAFPSYSFDVSSGVGLSVAVPVKGVPLGLSIMGTDDASGTITIKNAYSYGLSAEVLLEKLWLWAGDADVQEKLSQMAKMIPKRLYLRVLTRVFMAGNMQVNLFNNKALKSDVSGGAEQPSLMKLVPVQRNKTTTEYKAEFEVLNEALNRALPGGRLQVVQASGRSVFLQEEFCRPLVLGYRAFDVEVTKQGRLGAVIVTSDFLEKMIPAPSSYFDGWEPDVKLNRSFLKKFNNIGDVDVQLRIAQDMSDQLRPSDLDEYVNITETVCGISDDASTCRKKKEKSIAMFVMKLNRFTSVTGDKYRTQRVNSVFENALKNNN